MIKTLIVDDEPNIREGLSLIIDWNSLGYEIVGEASNGKEALLQIKTLMPEVVITDIKMPEISGLELISECKKRGCETSFIILSGYSDFSMAKKALSLGATDYLLKPVDEDELTQILIKLRDKKLKSRSNKVYDTYYLKAQMEELLSSNSKRDLTVFKESFNITNQISYYYIMLDTYGEISLNTIFQLFKESIVPKTTITILEHNCDCFGLLIHSGILKEHNNSINMFLMFLISEIYKKTNIEVSIYLGSKKRDLYKIKDSKDEAQIASSHRYYREKGLIIDYNNIQFIEFSYTYIESIYVEKIVNGVLNRDDKEIKNNIDNLVEYFLEEYLSAQIIYIHLNRLFNNLLKAIKDLNGSCDQIIDSAKFIIYREKQIYLSSLTPKILNLTNVSLEIVKKIKVGSNLGLELKNYIDLNYKQNLSLKCVSDIFKVNSAYLGQAFKKETGIGFNSYIHKLRLDKARDILENTNLKIYEVAESVGYQDVNYFMKKFENFFKTTPKQYRKIHNNSTNL